MFHLPQKIYPYDRNENEGNHRMHYSEAKFIFWSFSDLIVMSYRHVLKSFVWIIIFFKGRGETVIHIFLSFQVLSCPWIYFYTVYHILCNSYFFVLQTFHLIAPNCYSVVRLIPTLFQVHLTSKVWRFKLIIYLTHETIVKGSPKT